MYVWSSTYIPAKSHKWSYKLFVLCGVSGFAYNFDIYTVTQNNERNRLPDEPDLGSTSNVLVRLARNVPRAQNFTLYFDNYYKYFSASNALLANKWIHSLGTVRRTRIHNYKLPSDSDIKKESRGTSCEYVCDFNGVEILSVIWKDNKSICLLSTFTGEIPITEK